MEIPEGWVQPGIWCSNFEKKCVHCNHFTSLSYRAVSYVVELGWKGRRIPFIWVNFWEEACSLGKCHQAIIKYYVSVFLVTIEGEEIDGLVTVFRGFHIRAMRVDWDPEEAIGSFTQFDEAIVRAQSWYPIREGDIVSGFLCSRFELCSFELFWLIPDQMFPVLSVCNRVY